MASGVILEDLSSYGKDFGFYFKENENIFKGFKQESDVIWFTFLKDHSVIFRHCCEENRMEGSKSDGRETR